MSVEAHRWAISNEAFWWLFLFACALPILARVVRYRLGRADGGGADATLDVYELAELSGGRDRVAMTAAAQLYQTGHLTVQDGAVATQGRLTGAVAPIERALFQGVAQASVVEANRFLYEPGAALAGSAHREIVAAMADRGLLATQAVTSLLRWLVRFSWALQVILLVREWIVLDRMPFELVAVSMLFAVVAGFLVERHPPNAGRGRSALDRQRERHAHLRSGPVDSRKLALAVALFGGQPLRLSNAEFARRWGILSPEEHRESVEEYRYYWFAGP